jgi:hypothetical protein
MPRHRKSNYTYHKLPKRRNLWDKMKIKMSLNLNDLQTARSDHKERRMSSVEQVFAQVASFIANAWSDHGESFELINNSAPVSWVLLTLWLLVPALRPVRFIVRGYILTICVVYLLKLLPILSSGRFEGFHFAAILKAFQEPDVVVVCWAHFIAFDLHAGYTVVEKAHSIGFGLFVRLLLVPALGLILAFGPIGFLVGQVLIFFFGLFARSPRADNEDPWANKGPGLPTSRKSKTQ